MKLLPFLAVALLASCAVKPVKKPDRIPLTDWQAGSHAKVLSGMYITAYGNPRDQAVIFVHGGPGFNSRDFEVAAAEELAQRGYYVLAYDQRGQGRSLPTDDSNFNYHQYALDLMAIISQYRLDRPVLIGHSHGGPVSIKFEEEFPSVAGAIILVSAPVNFWESMKALYSNCTERYHNTPGTEKYLDDLVRNFDILVRRKVASKDLVGPVAAVFGHGLIGCRVYQTSFPTEEEIAIRRKFQVNPAPMDHKSMPGFLVNENYIYLSHFGTVLARKGRFFGIYGNEDGLFNPTILTQIENALGSSRFHLVKGASHAVYVDQRKKFLDTVDKIISGLKD